MSPQSTSRYDKHSTSTSSRGWTAHRIAIAALFTAIAIVMSYLEIPLFPAAPYLKYDPSGVVCMIAGFAFGPYLAAVISILMWIPHLFGNPIGAIMGMIATLSYTVPAAQIYAGNPTKKRAIIGMSVGGAISITLAILANLIFTPLYTPIAVSEVVALIIPILLPFNLVKVTINSVICTLIYKRVVSIVAR